MGEKKGLFNFLKFDSLFDHLTAFIESKIEVYKIEAKEELSLTISKIMVGLLFVCIAFLFVLYINFALGYYLGTLLDSIFYGFLIISGFYLLLFVTLLLLRDKIGLRKFFEKKLTHWFNADK